MIGTPSNHQLAIIIPAFKGEYLAKALDCLLRQTDQRFNIYICDDASPADVQGITSTVLGTRPYTYQRFENNLGRVSLARQWDRCVAVANEPWIWLFSDDDLMENGCVEAFYRFLEQDGETADILRFGVWVVDADGKITAPFTVDIDTETWLEFAYGHFMGWRSTLMQNLVFRRSAFERMERFLDLPFCWGTEFAAVIAMARQRPIKQIRGARVFWRISGKNITPDRSVRTRTRKLQAACQFLRWFHGQLQMPREHLFEDDAVAFQLAMDRFLVHEIANNGALPALANWNLLSRTRVEVCHGDQFALLKYIGAAAVSDCFSVLGRIAKTLIGRSNKS